MSDAPERIWAWEYKGNSPWGPIKPDLDVVTNGAEYVRADRIEELELAVRYEADLAQQALDARKELEDKKYHDAWLEAEAKIVELETKLAAKEKLVLALAGDKIDLVSELGGVRGKLAKAVKLAEEAFDFNIEDDGPRAWHSINDRIAELKGQDDE